MLIIFLLARHKKKSCLCVSEDWDFLLYRISQGESVDLRANKTACMESSLIWKWHLLTLAYFLDMSFVHFYPYWAISIPHRRSLLEIFMSNRSGNWVSGRSEKIAFQSSCLCWGISGCNSNLHRYTHSHTLVAACSGILPGRKCCIHTAEFQHRPYWDPAKVSLRGEKAEHTLSNTHTV